VADHPALPQGKARIDFQQWIDDLTGPLCPRAGCSGRLGDRGADCVIASEKLANDGDTAR